MLKFLEKHSAVITLEILVIIAFVLFYGRFGDINFDSFREAYIPLEMLNGKVLYKDIFCIYPPLSYFINSILFLCFGVKLTVLYIVGLLTTLGIVFFTFKTCRFFFGNIISFCCCFLLISAFILSPNVFNSFFPYSYGMLYGIFFIMLSIYFLLNKKFPFSYLFYSFAICSKIEFIFLLPLLLAVSKKQDIKKNLAALIIPPVIIFLILIIQGCRFEDFATAFSLIKIMSSTDTLKNFYTSMGLIFTPQILKVYIENIFTFFVPYKFIYQEFIVWVYPVILLLFGIRYRLLSRNEKIFIAAALLAGVKVFYAVVLQSYGAFYLPMVLIALLIAIPKKLRKIFAVYFVIWSFIIGINNIKILLNKNYKIETNRGAIYSTPYYAEGISEVVNYIKSVPKESLIVVYPEGLVINYMAERSSDTKFYSLIPLYVETFGEDVIVKRLDLIKPDYIVLTNLNTSSYMRGTKGLYYATIIMNYINANYHTEKSFGTDYTLNVLKRN